MNARRVALAVAVALSVTARVAAGEPVHLQTPSSVQTDGGTSLRLPPGYFVEERVWSDLDKELRRLQDAETRLTVENKSMRSSLDSWQPGWVTLTVSLVAGIALGVYIDHRL